MAQPVTIGTQPFLLDFVVIRLKRKGYNAILGRGWLIQARVRHDWKKNTLSLESKGRRFVIDLHTQMVEEEALSSDFEEEEDERRQRMEPDKEGVLRLEGGSTDDDLDSVNSLFHWQMEDYELFQCCNVLTVEEGHNGDEFPREFKEMKEGDASLDETPAHAFTEGEPIKYNEATLQTMNLGDEVDESTSKKVELQQNESEKEIEVIVKTVTNQKLSEKMEINEMVEKKIENEESEGKRKKSKKRKRANKVKGEVKKITEEDREGKKIPSEVKKKTTVEEGHMKKITEEEGELKTITQGEGQLKTTKVDGKVEKKSEDDRRVNRACPDRGPTDTFFAGYVPAGSLLFPVACLYLPQTFVVRMTFYSPRIASWCSRAHLVHWRLHFFNHGVVRLFPVFHGFFCRVHCDCGLSSFSLGGIFFHPRWCSSFRNFLYFLHTYFSIRGWLPSSASSVVMYLSTPSSLWNGKVWREN